MKKLIAALVCTVLAVACAAPTEVTNTAPMSNANMAASPSPAAMITEAEASAKERAVWDDVRNKNYDSFSDSLAPEYVEASLDTLFDKMGTVNAVKELVITDASFSDWRLLPINNNVFVITYTVNTKGTYKGEPLPTKPVRASSAWVNRNGKWLAIYHQETETKATAAMQMPKAETAKPTPSVTSSPVTTGPDPVANEQAIWAALKAKNIDAFASMLAADALEVEPDGIYDKAGSIRSVSQFDASKMELSDFKPLRINDGAALVTYVARMAAPNGSTERHSTIWAERNGKWMAVFHQGTVLPKTTAKPAASSPATK